MVATTATILSVVGAVSSLAGGMSSRSEANNQAELALQQSEMAAKEQARVSFREAQLETDRADDFARKQKVAYLASGVTLDGSPLATMEETRRKGSENVNEILMSGAAGAEAARSEGRIQAQQLKSSGRKAFSAGLSSSIGQASSILGSFDA